MEQRRPEETHAFVATLVGRCLRCQRLQSEHVPMLDRPDPLTECPVDHASLNVALFATAAGVEWLRCPICTVMVEGKFASPIDHDAPPAPTGDPGTGNSPSGSRRSFAPGPAGPTSMARARVP
jgi:hypothetical protein